MLVFYLVSHETMPYTVLATHVSVGNRPAAPEEYTAWIQPSECE